MWFCPLTEQRVSVAFHDNQLASQLFGHSDENLSKIDERLNVSTSTRGNVLSITGAVDDIYRAKIALETLYKNLKSGQPVDTHEIDAAIRMVTQTDNPTEHSRNHGIILKTKKRHIVPYTESQKAYVDAMLHHDVTFGCGPAGTGKTYLAVAVGISLFLQKKVDRIILSRPVLEAGEKLGFLPGDLKQKIDPYLKPLYDAMHEMLPSDMVERSLASEAFEILPLAFMRGRTLKHAYIILDEAQNATALQVKMLLTRLGESSKIVIAGDPKQSDLPKGIPSGLNDALHILKNIPEIATVHFGRDDIVRHPLTAKIIEAYEGA